MQITILRQDALNFLYRHKEKHISTYEETVTGWKSKLEEYSIELNQWAQNGGKSEDRPKEPYKPKDYTTEYNQLIQRLEYHAEDKVLLDEHEFDEIINDRFGWTDGFLTTSAYYSAK